jgi:hypothetical protein
MSQLRSLAGKGRGKIAVLLPDTQSSARYVSFDEPYLNRAFQAAGLSSADYQIQNAQGSASQMQTQAEAAITNGASVLLVDPLDSGSGAAIEQAAAAKDDRLRPPHAQWQLHLLRELQQRERGPDDRPRLRRLRAGVERAEAAGAHHER